MDEAERCHKPAYIAYGTLLATGTAREKEAFARLIHGLDGENVLFHIGITKYFY
jgi:hypothetical protein